MSQHPTWLIELFINGPIAVRTAVQAKHAKGFGSRRQFYSDVAIRSIQSGLQCSVTAFAADADAARKAALVFVGEMLDVLALNLDQPLSVSLFDARRSERLNHSVRRVVTEDELASAFGQARLLAESQPTFLRALGYFRKGLTTEDPLDQFFAYWRSIEIVADKYHPNTPGVPTGSKSNIWECFKKIWGPLSDWPRIAGQQQWIDENHALRVQIAHGTASVDVEAVERASEKGQVIRAVARGFLADWWAKEFAPVFALI